MKYCCILHERVCVMGLSTIDANKPSMSCSVYETTITQWNMLWLEKELISCNKGNVSFFISHIFCHIFLPFYYKENLLGLMLYKLCLPNKRDDLVIWDNAVIIGFYVPLTAKEMYGDGALV